jgi:deoxyribose-phosphate aldolase
MTTTRDPTRFERPRAPIGAAGREPAPASPHRNPGTPLDLDRVRNIRVNRSAVERRAATIPARRTVKRDWQAAWLLRAVTCIDLTTLQGDDTPGTVIRLCAKARQPVRRDLLEAMGVAHLGIRVGAVCVYRALVETAVEALAGSGYRSPPCPPAGGPQSFPNGSRIRRRSPRARDRSAITRGHVLGRLGLTTRSGRSGAPVRPPG